MFVYGLTGGIGSGKSTVVAMLREQGLAVLDADEAARAVVEPGSEGLQAVVEAFGPEILRADGHLNREALGQRVFQVEADRLRLNALIHPLVRAELERQRLALEEEGVQTVVMDIPLLFETGDPTAYAGVVVVYVDEDTQLERLIRRNGLTEEEARARLAAQLPLYLKASKADTVIDNRGSLEQTARQVQAWVRLLEMQELEERLLRGERLELPEGAGGHHNHGEGCGCEET